jgi:ATP synthase protein I
VASVEPEREAIRRVLPLAPIALIVATVVAGLIGGTDAAWSAGIAVVIVFLNFIAAAVSVAWAARISPTILFAVALGGFVVRLMIYTIALVLLNTLEWFSPLAFALTLVPVTVGLLVIEARALSGRLQADMWSFEGAAR